MHAERVICILENWNVHESSFVTSILVDPLSASSDDQMFIFFFFALFSISPFGIWILLWKQQLWICTMIDSFISNRLDRNKFYDVWRRQKKKQQRLKCRTDCEVVNCTCNFHFFPSIDYLTANWAYVPNRLGQWGYHKLK